MKNNENENKTYKSPFTRRIIDIGELEKVLKNGCNHGVCGGHNLGNTCFMNSSIACLSNCTELTTYFLTEEYKKDINKSNKEGLGGKLANAWYSLLEDYWNSKIGTGNPSDVKSAVAKKVKKFSGYNQQDSNEFMTEFLSILGEDLNKTSKKIYKELDEKKDNETDFDCAKRFWQLHLSRNDSIVTDLFCGLFKSIVVCPECKWQSITFDPFNTLCLAIPSNDYLYKKKKTTEDITIFYIPKYSIRKSLRVNFRIEKDTCFDLITQEIQKIKDFNYKFNKLKYITVVDKELKQILKGNDIMNSKDFVFAFDDDDEEEEAIPLYIRLGNNFSSFPRLLFIKKNLSFGDLKKKIYYFARQFLINPSGDTQNKENLEIENELEKYINEKIPYSEEKLISLINKEYNEIFSQSKNEKFLNDFPYKIEIKPKFNSKDSYLLFDGKNKINEELNELGIISDNDSIEKLVDYITNSQFCLILTLVVDSSFIKQKIRLDSCSNVTSDNYKKDDYEKIRITLEDCLNLFIEEEHLDKDNEWYCKKCKNKVSASKKLEIFYLPRLMSICLNRFSKGRYSYCKNSEFIDFPIENLDMGKYLIGPDRAHSKYDLFAVSEHYGDTGGGHYTAVCKNIDGNWYHYNDSSCSRASVSDACSSSAYVLFYRRQNW